MSLLYSLNEWCIYNLHFFSWKDPVEVFFFTTIIYKFSCWLRADRSTVLLPYLYTAGIATGVSYFFHFPTIQFFIFFYGPACIMLFIVLHQQTLQKQYVTLHNIAVRPQETDNTDWPQHLVQWLLRARTPHPMHIVIEQYDALQPFMQIPIMLQSPLQPSLLTVLIDSSSYRHEHMILLNTAGTLVAMNCTWKQPAEPWTVADNLKNLSPWLADTLLMTGKTDCFALVYYSSTNTFDIVVQGKRIEALSGTEALRMITYYLSRSGTTNKKGDRYDIQYHQKHTSKQPHP